MKWNIFLMYLTCITIATNNVVTLTTKTFNNTIASDKPVLVKFFAPWCTHSKALAPEYAKVADEVVANGEAFIVGEVDGIEHPSIAELYNVKSFPTIKLFIDQVPINYYGERNASEILKFVRKKIQPSSEELTDLSKLKAQLNGKGRRCILVSDDEGEKKNYMIAARTMEAYTFFHTSLKIGKQIFKDIEGTAAVILRDFTKKQVIYKGAFDQTDFIPFLRKHQFDLIETLNDETANVIFKERIKMGMILITSKEADEAAKKVFTELASTRQSDEMLYLKASLESNWGKKYIDYYEIYEKELPIIELVDYTKGAQKRLRFIGNITLSELEEFVDTHTKITSHQVFKTEEAPKDNSGPIRKVVAKTFEREIISNDYDVLVKFYTDRCAGCKELTEAYSSLAERVEGNKLLRLVEIHGLKNDVPEYIESFPEIYLYPAGKKDTPIRFTGKVNVEELINFLKEKCTNPIQVSNQLKVDKPKETIKKVIDEPIEEPKKEKRDKRKIEL